MNIEEIKGLISEHKLEGDVALWASGTDKGKELLNNWATAQSQTAVNDAVRAVHDSYDNDLKELGIEKGGKKTYEAYKEAYNQLKSKVSELEPLANKKPDEVLKAQLESLQAELENKNNKIESLKGESTQFKKDTLINSNLNAIKLDERLDDNIKDLIIKDIKNKLNNQSEFTEDGTLIFKDSDGNLILNNEHKPISVNELLEKELSKFQSKPGGKKTTGTAESVKADVMIDLNGVTDTVQLTKKLRDEYIKRDLDPNSDAFFNDWNAHKQHLK